jgi:phosphopantothenoylcysteine decarboxylase/phosphopantothenate--cysteine ligase
MAAKQADAILLNDISGAETGFDSDRNAGLFITADSVLELPSMPKREMADRILDQLLTLRARLLVR